MDLERRFDAFRSRPTPEALVDLLEDCQDTVYSLCFHVLRHAQNAEDASQKVLLSLMDHLPKIADGVHFRRWIHTVCLHVSIDLKRKQETPKLHSAEVAARDSAPEFAEIHEHLALLDGEQRSLILEHYFDRRPLEAMAGTRGCSTVTVWNRLQKALHRLKKSLVEAGFEKAAFGLDAFLLAVIQVEAPRTLITAAVTAKAAAVPLSTSAVVGGAVLKTNILIGAAIAAAGVVMLFSVPIVRGVRPKPDEERPPILRFRRGPTEATAVAVAQLPAEAIPAAEPAVEGFAAIGDFTRALRKSLLLPNDAERWKSVRKLGFPFSDGQFLEVQSRVRRKSGSHAYAIAFEKLLIEAWTKRDPAAAASFFRDLPGPMEDPIKREMVSAVLSAWQMTDAKAAMKFAEALPSGAGRTRVANHLAAQENPAEFAPRIASMSGEERFKSLQDLADAWPTLDAASAVRWLSELSEKAERNHLLGRALAGWAGLDPAASVEWTLRLPADASRDELVREALLGAATARPREASELAMNLLKMSDPHTPSVLNGIAQAWVERDVAEGLRFAETLVERSVLGAERYLLLSRAAELDPAQALAWVNRRPEGGEDRDQMIEAVFKGWALSDQMSPQKALEAARTLPEAVRSRAIQGLLVGMCDYDPAGACAFAAGLPPAAVPFDALGERFAVQDMSAAASWARTLTDCPSRDQAITGILRLAKNWDLSMAISLAREVSSREVRHQAFTQLLDWAIHVEQKGSSADIRMKGVLCAWLQTDPDAPGAWVDQSGLPPAVKAEAYKVVGDPRRRASSKR